MKIVIFEIEGWERQAFDVLAGAHDVRFVREPLSADNVGAHRDAEVISVFIYSDVTKAVLEELGDLALIATRSTGFDHIDTDTCEARGVAVANVPSYGENTVAEHTFALLLTISHHMIDAVDRTRKGDFTQRGLQGFDLMGRTLGVVGTGAIGRHTIRIAKGFGMVVVAFDVQKDEAFAREAGFDYVSLDELLERSDVITLHVPLNDATRDLIAEEQFAKMKDGVVLLNTARGGVVKVEALVRALHTGKVRAAGLDVLPEEPAVREEAELLHRAFEDQHDLGTLLADHILLRMRNVVMTPHSAFNTREAVGRILDTTIANIEGFVAGRPENLVAGGLASA